MKRFISVILLAALFSLACASANADALWAKGNYIDEFNEPTGEEFAYIQLEGTFSNSATSNSELSVQIIVDFNDVSFSLLEYGRLKITSVYQSPTYTIRVKDGSDTIHTFSGWLSKSTSRIVLDPQYRDSMLDILNAGGRIRFSITSNDSASIKYNFTIDNANNFQTQWASAAGLAIGYMSNFSEGVVTVVNNNKMGVLNSSGEVVIPCEYDVIYNCSDGMLRVFNGEYITLDGGSRMVNGGTGKHGFISKDGTKTIAMEYDNASSFTCGRAFVKQGDKWGCIDKEGNLVIPYQYDYVSPYSEDIACVFIGTKRNNGYPDEGEYFYIDLDGNIIFSETDSVSSFSDGLARVSQNGKYGYIDKEGSLVIPAQWDDAGYFSNGRAWVKSNGQISFIDTTGAVIATCSEPGLTSVSTFSDGMAYAYDVNYKYGFLNEEGTLVIPCKFKYVGTFVDGYTFAKDENQKYGIIDKTGTFVVPCQWDEIRRVGNYYSVRKYATFSDKTGVGIGGTYGLIDPQGNIVLDCIYSSINYGEGYYTVSTDSEWLVFDDDLNRVF